MMFFLIVLVRLVVRFGFVFAHEVERCEVLVAREWGASSHSSAFSHVRSWFVQPPWPYVIFHYEPSWIGSLLVILSFPLPGQLLALVEVTCARVP